MVGARGKKKGRADRLPTRPDETWVETAELGDLAQFLGLAQGLQLFEALVLDLADPLTGDVERPADLVQGPRVLAAEPVTELEHATLAVGEVLEGFLQRLFGQQVGGPVERGLGLLVGDELTELGLLLVA